MKLPEHSSYGLKLILLVVGLPLLVAVLGSWQMTRTPEVPDVPAIRAEIQQTIESLRQLQQEKGNFATVRASDGKSYSVQMVSRP